MESDLEILRKIQKTLKLNFSDESIEIMLKLLEGGVNPDNLIKILEKLKNDKINSFN